MLWKKICVREKQRIFHTYCTVVCKQANDFFSFTSKSEAINNLSLLTGEGAISAATLSISF